MKSGAWVGVAILTAAAAMLSVILYMNSDTRRYQKVSGLTEITIGGARFAVRDYQGLDSPNWPLRLRGCFTLADPEGALQAGRPDPEAVPFGAPSFFECWEPKQTHDDLLAGRAKAVIAEVTGDEAFAQERVVVIYPDGRAYQWRRPVTAE